MLDKRVIKSVTVLVITLFIVTGLYGASNYLYQNWGLIYSLAPAIIGTILLFVSLFSLVNIFYKPKKTARKKEGDWVRVHSAGNPQEAEIIKGKLKSEKIPVALKKANIDLIGNIYPSAAVGGNMGIIDVYVPKDFSKKARSIIR